MLHLLPQYQKRKVVKEYRLRLGLVLIIVIFFAVIMFTIFTLPSFLLLRTEKIVLEGKKSSIESIINSKNLKNGDSATDMSKSAVALKPFSKSLSPNLFIDSVVPSTSGITIGGYAFNQAGPEDPVNVVISGVSKTREDLTAYAELLNKRFGGVKLPLSSLANSANISFEFRFAITYDKALAVKDDKDKNLPEVLGTSTEDMADGSFDDELTEDLSI